MHGICACYFVYTSFNEYTSDICIIMWRKKKRRGMRTYLIAVIIDDARHGYDNNHRKWTYEEGNSDNYSIIDRIVWWRGRDRTLLGEGRKQMNINIISMNSERARACMGMLCLMHAVEEESPYECKSPDDL